MNKGKSDHSKKNILKEQWSTVVGVTARMLANYQLPVTGYRLQVTSYRLQVAGCLLRVTSFTSYRLPVASYQK